MDPERQDPKEIKIEFKWVFIVYFWVHRAASLRCYPPSMADILAKVLHAVTAKSYVPLKAKPLFKRINMPESE